MTSKRISWSVFTFLLGLVTLFALSRALGRLPASRYTHGSLAPGLAAVSPVPEDRVETGTHWADPADYPVLQHLGYRFVITAVHPTDQREWTETFNAARASGLQLIVGLYPPPYRLVDGVWQLGRDGEAFLRYASARASLVKAIFVYNEPFWLNPFTGKNDPCGALSAAQLRELRTAIRGVWPEARIYHDLGRPSDWAPGGAQPQRYPCVGDKYADWQGVADFVGIWFFPFEMGRYRRSQGLVALASEVAYVRNKMQANPVILDQAFECHNCGEATRLPTAEELRDWNCATRALRPYAITWYPWRQASYDDYLAAHPEMWSASAPTACP
jgi:hypothetical protein